MNKCSILERSHYQDYLVRLYFGLSGPEPDYLGGCINTAYLDFCRTLWGLRGLDSKSKNELRAGATNMLREIVSELISHPIRIKNQEDFDTWHRCVCQELSDLYKGYGYDLWLGGDVPTTTGS